MPNLIVKSGSTSIPGAIVKGNFSYFSGNTVNDLGPSSSTGFYMGYDPPLDGYTVYQIGGPNGWTPRVAQNRTQLNRILISAGATGTTVEDNITWATNTNNVLIDSNVGAYIYDDPFMVFDFSNSSRYFNTGTTIADLSGYGNDGTFITGTNLGTPATVSGYSGGTPGSLALNLNNTTQNSVRLVDTAKFLGTQQYTMCAWIRINGLGNGTFPGVFAYGSSTVGWTHIITGEATRRFYSERPVTVYNTPPLAFNGTDLPTISSTAWYFTSVRYNGSILSSDIFMNGTRYITSGSTTSPIADAGATFAAYMGLRFNNWMNAYYGYAAGYTTDIGVAGITAIYNATKSRYGL